ncbi:hypothetical protein ACTA71_006565 [Dictyostelium dimigraforme]
MSKKRSKETTESSDSSEEEFKKKKIKKDKSEIKEIDKEEKKEKKKDNKENNKAKKDKKERKDKSNKEDKNEKENKNELEDQQKEDKDAKEINEKEDKQKEDKNKYENENIEIKQSININKSKENEIEDDIKKENTNLDNNEKKIKEILKFNDKEDMKRIDFKKQPWFESIKEKFSNIIWSKNINESPTILVIFDEVECESFVDMIASIYNQELSILPNSGGTPLNSKRIIVGFDLEGIVPYSLQISTKTVSAVIYIKAMGKLTDGLIKLLKDKTVIKAGTGVKSDFDRILKIFPTVKSESALDVGCVAFRSGITKNYLPLDVLSIDLLGIGKYDFDRQYQPKPNNRKDWIAQTIDDMDQHKYAAIDAWLGFKLAETLYSNLKNHSSFYDWSKSNLTGNFQFRDHSDFEKEESIIFDGNGQINYFPSSNNNNNNNNPPKSNPKNFNLIQESKALNKTKNAEKYEKANNHENLFKLQEIKKKNKRPFI